MSVAEGNNSSSLGLNAESQCVIDLKWLHIPMNVQATRYAHVHFGFRQKNTSSIRSCSQNTGPTCESVPIDGEFRPESSRI